MASYKLIYFDTRGRAEGSRLLFAYAGIPYEDIRVSHEDFGAKKSTYPFGQLPVLEVDGKMLAQSHTIERYLARTFGLTGKDDWESAKCDMLVDGFADLMPHMLVYRHEQDPEKKKEILAKLISDHMVPFMKRYEVFLMENGGVYFVGNKLTWADIILSEFFAACQLRSAQMMDNFPKLQEFTGRIQNVPNIKNWLENRPKEELK